MCSSFNQNLQKQDLTALIDKILGLSEIEVPRSKIFPGRPAITFKADESESHIQAENMQFSLIPRWSKEPKVKFATHNARLETVLEKATWKDAFSKRHCVVPISGFIEPIYDGPKAGNMVEFSAPHSILLAAGIWEDWTDKSKGEVISSFSILTHEPYSYVKKMGHDRSPIFLNPKNAKEWLKASHASPKKWVQFLTDCRFEPDFEVQIDRPLKAKK